MRGIEPTGIHTGTSTVHAAYHTEILRCTPSWQNAPVRPGIRFVYGNDPKSWFRSEAAGLLANRKRELARIEASWWWCESQYHR
jgi:hypothetical protein